LNATPARYITAGLSVGESMDIDHVISKLEEDGFPILRKTLQFIASIENSKDPIPKLAEKILSDPGMAMKLVQIANSPFFNPSGVRIRTVTRAILLIGLQNVKAIALGLALMDDLVSKGKKRKLGALFAMAIARAVMTKNLGAASKCFSLEEMYIAGLLHDIGEIAIELLVEDETLQEIQKKAEKTGEPVESIQRKELGFSARDLTKAINDRWKLSEILSKALSGVCSTETLCLKAADQLIQIPDLRKEFIGVKFSTLFDSYSETLSKEIRQIEKLLKINSREIQQILEDTKKETQYFLTNHFSLPYLEEKDIDAFKPGAELSEAKDQIREKVDEIKVRPSEESVEEPGIDFQLIMNLSYDIVSLIHNGLKDPNALFSLAMELIYNGLNMDVVLFLLITPDRKACFVRHSFIKPEIRALFIPERIPLEGDKDHLFSYVAKNGEPLWVGNESPTDIIELVKHPVISSFTDVPSFVAPIHAKKRLIGFIYADGRSKPDRITEDHFAGFSMTAKLASIGLTLLIS
jgi:HD-like signal output (HDOD) protein